MKKQGEKTATSKKKFVSKQQASTNLSTRPKTRQNYHKVDQVNQAHYSNFERELFGTQKNPFLKMEQQNAIKPQDFQNFQKIQNEIYKQPLISNENQSQFDPSNIKINQHSNKYYPQLSASQSQDFLYNHSTMNNHFQPQNLTNQQFIDLQASQSVTQNQNLNTQHDDENIISEQIQAGIQKYMAVLLGQNQTPSSYTQQPITYRQQSIGASNSQPILDIAQDLLPQAIQSQFQQQRNHQQSLNNPILAGQSLIQEQMYLGTFNQSNGPTMQSQNQNVQAQNVQIVDQNQVQSTLRGSIDQRQQVDMAIENSLARNESQETAQFSTTSHPKLSPNEFNLLQNVVQNLNIKICEMSDQTQDLQNKLKVKNLELRNLRKQKRLGSSRTELSVSNQSSQRFTSRPHSSQRALFEVRSQKSIVKKVTAREMSSQTPMSYLSARQTKLFLDKKHAEILKFDKQQAFFQLSQEVDQREEFLSHINELEKQIELLNRTLVNQAPHLISTSNNQLDLQEVQQQSHLNQDLQMQIGSHPQQMVFTTENQGVVTHAQTASQYGHQSAQGSLGAQNLSQMKNLEQPMSELVASQVSAQNGPTFTQYGNHHSVPPPNHITPAQQEEDAESVNQERERSKSGSQGTVLVNQEMPDEQEIQFGGEQEPNLSPQSLLLNHEIALSNQKMQHQIEINQLKDTIDTLTQPCKKCCQHELESIAELKGILAQIHSKFANILVNSEQTRGIQADLEQKNLQQLDNLTSKFTIQQKIETFLCQIQKGSEKLANSFNDSIENLQKIESELCKKSQSLKEIEEECNSLKQIELKQQKQISQISETLVTKQSQHETEVRILKKSHSEQIQQLQKEHEFQMVQKLEQITDQMQQNTTESGELKLEQITQKHKEQIETIQRQHQDKLDQVRKELEKEGDQKLEKVILGEQNKFEMCQESLSKVMEELKLKDSMITQLTEQITKQAWQFQEEEASKKKAQKDRLRAIITGRASQASSAGSSQAANSPKNSNSFLEKTHSQTSTQARQRPRPGSSLITPSSKDNLDGKQVEQQITTKEKTPAKQQRKVEKSQEAPQRKKFQFGF